VKINLLVFSSSAFNGSESWAPRSVCFTPGIHERRLITPELAWSHNKREEYARAHES
jgi:hypothetical protein